MTPRPNISIFISRLAFSLLLCLAATTISAQGKLFALQKDSIPLFRGFSVSVDIAGPIASHWATMENMRRHLGLTFTTSISRCSNSDMARLTITTRLPNSPTPPKPRISDLAATSTF